MNIEQMVRTIPQLQPYFNKGMSYEQIFREICKQRQINPDEFVKNLQQQFYGKKF